MALRRDGQSDFFDNLKVMPRGTLIVKSASKKVVAEGGVETKEDAHNLLNKFDKSKDIPDEYIAKHKERLDDEEPKEVVKDFFKGLQDVKKSKNTLQIRTAKLLRQNGQFKKASKDVYQDLATNDFWKVSEDKKHVIRLFKELDGGVANRSANKK
jgi:hypothetical protein